MNYFKWSWSVSHVKRKQWQGCYLSKYAESCSSISHVSTITMHPSPFNVAERSAKWKEIIIIYKKQSEKCGVHFYPTPSELQFSWGTSLPSMRIQRLCLFPNTDRHFLCLQIKSFSASTLTRSLQHIEHMALCCPAKSQVFCSL